MNVTYLNDERIDPQAPLLSAFDAGFALGEGALETMVAQGGRIRLGHRHRSRLANGLEHLGLEMIDWNRLERRAKAASADTEQLLLRLIVTRGALAAGFGSDPLGTPTEFLVIRPFVPPPSPRTALLVDWPRRNAHSVRAHFKCLGYADELLARRRSIEADAQIAILKSNGGSIASFDSANLFALTAGRLLTPPTTEGALAGTVRSELLSRGAIGGVPVAEASLAEADLGKADAVLLTNAAFGIAPLQHIVNVPQYVLSDDGLAFSRAAFAELFPRV